jgi:hypothetical protein
MKRHTEQQRLRLLEQGACYLCEEFKPTHVDEVGGNICADCEAHMQAVQSKYARKDAYSARRRVMLPALSNERTSSWHAPETIFKKSAGWPITGSTFVQK